MRAVRRKRPRVASAVRPGADPAGDVPLRWALADWLFYRRLSGREFARRASLGHATVQRLVSGHTRRVELRTLAALCRVLHVTPADLIVWQGQDPLPPGARSRARQLRLPGRNWL
jgi:DNA-binding Xre family transcriptional regulator